MDAENVNDDGELMFSDSEEDNLLQEQPSYTILGEDEIRRCQEEDITTVSTVLAIPRTCSSILLLHYNWNTCDVEDSWFEDEEKVRKAVGLLEKPIVEETPEKVSERSCPICLENFSFSLDETVAAACGHLFCVSCWRDYISISISDGPGCLMLQCPHQACNVAIGQDMIFRFVSEEDEQKFSHYFVRSYIESNRKKIKWCPAPDCRFAVAFDAIGINGSSSYDVTCSCSYSFCWNCSEEVHRPLDCETVAKWVLKQSSDGETMNWLLTNSKPCPKCKRQIEKNEGCAHMTCSSPCGYEFCWLCLGSWSEHAGENYSCNGFTSALINGSHDEAEKKREMAKNFLDRYAHYYERWVSNHASRKIALADLHQIQTENKLKKLSLKELSEMDRQFVIEALVLVIECRRLLKWTYAYGYYIPENQDVKRQLFEYLQGEAEYGLEKLHHCLEMELQGYLEADYSITSMYEYLTKLVTLTKVTRNYFENLLQALENGLSDVTCSGGGRARNLKSLGDGKESLGDGKESLGDGKDIQRSRRKIKWFRFRWLQKISCFSN